MPPRLAANDDAAAPPAPSPAGPDESASRAPRKAPSSARRPQTSNGGWMANPILAAAATVVGKTAFPAILALIVLFFLTIQDRIDRNDPKLALAPVHSEPLDFTDPVPPPIGK